MTAHFYPTHHRRFIGNAFFVKLTFVNTEKVEMNYQENRHNEKALLALMFDSDTDSGAFILMEQVDGDFNLKIRASKDHDVHIIKGMFPYSSC